MPRHGKKYQQALEKYDQYEQYSYDDAIRLVKELSFVSFDETVEVHVRLNIKRNQSIRDTVVLPNQFKGEKKILVFAKGDKAEEARQAGATYVGEADLIEKIREGWLDFDVAVATPDMMKDVGRLGPILGRRGLMPNPKTQTVTFDLTAAIAELQKGRVEFRADKTGVVHLAIGRVSMEPAQIKENLAVLMHELVRKRPSDVKGDFIRSVALCTTMGPAVMVNPRDTI